jgi:hypothetical protein
MKLKKFFNSVAKVLNIDFIDKEESKILALEKLLVELREDRAKIEKKLRNKEITHEQKEELKEEIKIYSMHIKKGEEILEKKLAKKYQKE